MESSIDYYFFSKSYRPTLIHPGVKEKIALIHSVRDETFDKSKPPNPFHRTSFLAEAERVKAGYLNDLKLLKGST